MNLATVAPKSTREIKKMMQGGMWGMGLIWSFAGSAPRAERLLGRPARSGRPSPAPAEAAGAEAPAPDRPAPPQKPPAHAVCAPDLGNAPTALLIAFR
jgi:hypothetical protein